jgi:hypothetical protein
MKIAYVARHNSGGNDDEGAIAYALTQLGHDVACIPEHASDLNGAVRTLAGGADLILLNHADPSVFYQLKDLKVPKVFWFLDLVQWPDITLRKRTLHRIDWFNRVIKYVDAGFCTDGDWVKNDPTGKLTWLPQGADERVVGMGDAAAGSTAHVQRERRILFTGIVRGGGVGRIQWYEEMVKRDRGDGVRLTCINRGVYRRELANVIAAHEVFVCPDSPTTHNYWSNRVYNACGFGAFVVHPWCGEVLQSHYRDDSEIRYYHSMTHLFPLIDHYLEAERERLAICRRALARTVEAHLYRHRCQDLLEVCREKGLVRL